jgi:hypothetical protein
MEIITTCEPRQNRLLIIVLTLSALLTAGHFISGHHISGIAANATAQEQVSRV